MYAVISARAEGRETSPKRSRVRVEPSEVKVGLAYRELLKIEAECIEHRANGWRGGTPQAPIKRVFDLFLTRDDVETILEQLFSQGIPEQMGIKLYRESDLQDLNAKLRMAKKSAERTSSLLDGALSTASTLEV